MNKDIPANSFYYLRQKENDSDRMFFVNKPCPQCHASGYISHYGVEKICPECSGHKILPVKYIRTCEQDPFFCPEGGICEQCDLAEEYFSSREAVLESIHNLGR